MGKNFVDFLKRFQSHLSFFNYKDRRPSDVGSEDTDNHGRVEYAVLLPDSFAVLD